MRYLFGLLVLGLVGCADDPDDGQNGDGDADADGDGDGDTDADADADGDADADADADGDADADADGDADCEDVGEPCYEGEGGTPGVGPCLEGVIVCEAGVSVCRDWVGPSPETCNSLDDDCDGTVDGPAASSGNFCQTDLVGACQLGHVACIDGADVCQPDIPPVDETCSNNGADDDCNGVNDDVPNQGGECDSGLPGICAEGALACEGDALACFSLPELQGGTEACGTGADEDCDGEVDEADCVSCLNPGGGALVADNGTGADELYCYEADDSTETRARKACESHFGEGACCVIMGGYQSMQYGDCDLGGNQGSIHWHWDNHPQGHCGPEYVIGDVVSPGWCGVILGNMLN